jgi:hypothetical protein
MNGGMGGGASERAAGNAAREMNAARQGIGRAGQVDRLNLGIADDNTKMALLGQTANIDFGVGQQKLGADQFNSGMIYDTNKTNTANTIKGVDGENDFNLGKYAEGMKAWGAGQQAAATAGGGKK